MLVMNSNRDMEKEMYVFNTFVFQGIGLVIYKMLFISLMRGSNYWIIKTCLWSIDSVCYSVYIINIFLHLCISVVMQNIEISSSSHAIPKAFKIVLFASSLDDHHYGDETLNWDSIYQCFTPNKLTNQITRFYRKRSTSLSLLSLPYMSIWLITLLKCTLCNNLLSWYCF